MTADEALNVLENGPHLTPAQARRLADLTCVRARDAMITAVIRGKIPTSTLIDALKEAHLDHDEIHRLADILGRAVQEDASVDWVDVLGHLHAGDITSATILIERGLSESARHDAACTGTLFRRLAEARAATAHTETAP